MQRNKKTGIAGIIITIIVLIIIVTVSNINIQDITYVENSLGTLVMPIQNGLTYLKNWISRKQLFFYKY